MKLDTEAATRNSKLETRIHALDSLRGFAMLLGVSLHAAIAFMETPPPFWPVRDPGGGPAADVFLLAVHSFRMQLFFLLAGLFGGLLVDRYGVGGMAAHRLRRIGLPFALGVLLVVPSLQAAWVYAQVRAVRAGTPPPAGAPGRGPVADALAADPSLTAADVLWEYFASGQFLRTLLPMHLWFLYYLLILFAAVVLLAPACRRLAGTRLLAAIDAAFRRVVLGRGRILIPAALTVPLLYPMHAWTIDTPVGWAVEWHLLAYYAGFFAFGWLLYRHRDLIPAFGRRWALTLTLANAVVLPLMLAAVAAGVGASRADPRPGWLPAARLAVWGATAAYTWLMIAGLWGGFLWGFSSPRAWVRYLADASYWCYLASLTPLIVIQAWLADVPLAAPLKFAAANLLTFAVLLASYQWCVRHTVIGAVLNGRRWRGPEPAGNPAEVGQVAEGSGTMS